MHITLTVAIDGDIPASELREALDAIMARFDENLEVLPHRDTSVYAESFADQLAEAKAHDNDDWTEGLTDAEIVEQWSGSDQFDTDGWPITTRNPDGKWDWWVIGGRWGGAWTLKGEDGPLRSEGSAFGFTERANSNPHTDSARWGDIAPESVEPSFAWVNLAGEWHTRWVGPTREEAVEDVIPNHDNWHIDQKTHDAAFMRFLAELPLDTWLVNVDCHN